MKLKLALELEFDTEFVAMAMAGSIHLNCELINYDIT